MVHDTSTQHNLLLLPNEIISQALSYLDKEPPSCSNRLQQPTNDFTYSSYQPLKDVSLSCRRLRTLSLAYLFKYTRLDAHNLTEFLSFINVHGLNDRIRTVTASLQGSCTRIEPLWWARIFNRLPALASFTVQAAPHVLSQLTGIYVDDSEAWAFNMPIQTLTLTRQQPQPQSFYPYDAIDYDSVPNLLMAKDWTACTFNEGSSIKAYTTYEYYLRLTPSLMTIPIANSEQPIVPLSTPFSTLPSPPALLSPIPVINHFYESLESFTFVAIFPFYNHVDDVCSTVRRMKNLKHLSIKLCPDPDSTVLEDEIEQAKGHFDVNDPWNE